MKSSALAFFFFFNDTATTEIYTLSLHDALPIYADHRLPIGLTENHVLDLELDGHVALDGDRKSTRLNSSHSQISYAVFCLKKKKKPYEHDPLAELLAVGAPEFLSVHRMISIASC